MSEKHHRSLLKGISWRIVGTIDTTLLSWLFTGAIHKALRIGGIEFFTKIILYYLHERIWLAVPWGRTVAAENGRHISKDQHHRSIAKGVSWRIIGTIDTTIIAFLITGRLDKALSIGLTEIVTKVFLYYVHERIWQRISLGRHSHAPEAPQTGSSHENRGAAHE
ncbi:MAG: DUF2061 domain-containing protein [bacterium]